MAGWGTAVVDGPRIELYDGPRRDLRALFELAEDSPAQLDAYLALGRVLVARFGAQIVGHLQVVATGRPCEAEIKNMAVLTPYQGRRIGRALVDSLIEMLADEKVTTLLVATAAADLDNLRFYQRRGFRMRSVERDAFTEATGYPPGLLIDGIALRDRVWLDLTVPTSHPAPSSS